MFFKLSFPEVCFIAISAISFTHAQDCNSVAATVWFVVFNEPTKCITSPGGSALDDAKCGGADVFGQAFLDSISKNAPDASLIAPNAQAKIGVIYGSGGISDGYGNLTLVANLWRTVDPLNNTLPGLDPLGLQTGWFNPDAEVHLVIRSHGDVVWDGDGYVEQITNFLEPFCNDPLLAFEGEKATDNVCSDIQDLVSASGVSGDLPVMWIADASPVEGARAIFKRHGHAIQAVVETNVVKESELCINKQEEKDASSPAALNQWHKMAASAVVIVGVLCWSII